jgi:hypothetical protein
MGMLSDEEHDALLPARLAGKATPVPTQVVSSDEFMPMPQTEQQKKVEARMNALGDEFGKTNGLSRRRFFQTAAGMATAFVAMNEIYGPLYGASPAEARSVDLAQARSDGLKDQFIMDVHTHFLRDDTRLEGFVRGARGGRQGGLEPGSSSASRRPSRTSSIPNWFKEIYPRQRHQGGADQRLGLGGSARLVPDQRDEGRRAREGERRPVRSAACRTPSSRRVTTAGWTRSTNASRGQARFLEGLHGRRQHQQGSRASSLAHGRREARLSLLREDREVRPRHRLRAQGPLSAVGVATLAASHALRDGRRCRQGREGLAADPLRRLPLGLPLDRRARRCGGRLRPVREDRPGRLDQRSRGDSRPGTASATSTPTWARSSPRRRSTNRACARP